MLVLFSSISLVGNAQNVKIQKGNIFYRVQGTGANATFTKYVVDKSFSAKLIDKTDYLQIRPDKSVLDGVGDITNTYVTKSTPIGIASPTGLLATLSTGSKPQFFFPDLGLPDPDSTPKDYFGYSYSKLMIQTLAIPLKIRPQIKSLKNEDSLSSQVESTFNIGFAIGPKFVFERWKDSKNLLGTNSNRITLAPGALINFGSTTLDDKSTRPKLTLPRKAFTCTVGIVGLIGFNNVNVGIATGWDFVFGSRNEDWLYQGKNWVGFIVGLDLLK